MNRKNMAKMINAKFEKWVKTIDDEKVRNLVRNNTILSGGAIASMVQGEDVNDYDFYFRNRETTLAVANYYVNVANGIAYEYNDDCNNKQFSRMESIELLACEDNIINMYAKKYELDSDLNPILDKELISMKDHLSKRVNEGAIIPYVASEGIWKNTLAIRNEYIVKKDEKTLKTYEPIVITSNAISLTDDVQLILRFYGEVEELHSNYDFQHAFGYWESWNNKVVIDADTYDCITSRTLIYRGSKYPLCSLARIRKFIARGYTISAGELLKITYNLAQFDFTDVSVLEEQLMGLDSFYFISLITSLRKWKETQNDITSECIINFVTDKIDELF